MILEKVISYTKELEDPKNPLLGPTLKGLYLFGLWKTGSKFRSIAYNFIHFLNLLFVISQFVDLYIVRHDITKVLNNISLNILSTIGFVKCNSYIMYQAEWRELVQEISAEEILQIKKKDPIVTKKMEDYTRYTRIITYLYWVIVFATILLLTISPVLKYISSQSYREEISMGIEPLPQIMYSWFPFDNTKMPGYLGSIFVHLFMGIRGAGVLGVYDMNAVAIMTYLKGQMIILKEKCNGMFENVTSTQDILENIKECHKHHNTLIKHYSVFNSLMSPTMFIYVLMCSIMICGSVVQLSSILVPRAKRKPYEGEIDRVDKQATTTQKLWVIQFTSSLVLQLFLYCWHSNEVTLQSIQVDRGVYNSDWWQSNVRVRKQLLLLAGKLNHPFTLNAGPYTTLCVPTFIDIMKGSYSFFTLFSQIQDY